nr:hypothetical protein [Tanacetum cinerariifolium]
MRLRDPSSLYYHEVSVEVSIEIDIEDSIESGVDGDIERDTESYINSVILGDIKARIIAEAAIAIEADRALEVRAITADTERTLLLERISVLEGSVMRLQETLIVKRERTTSVENHLGYVIEELRVMTIIRSGMKLKAIEELINQRVVEALTEQETNHNLGPIIGCDDEYGDDNSNGGGNRNGNSGGNENGNGGGNGNGNDGRNGNCNRRNGGVGGNAPVARVFTFKNFLNCQPHNFSGTEGVVGSARWFEKMESVYHISNNHVDSQVKFATYTMLDGALTWLNSHVNKLRKLENKLWNLSVKGTDVAGYTRQFHELSLLCSRMVLLEEDKIERNAENKRKLKDNPRDNHV